MGSVNIDNTGSGADVTLSSDGTDLLLDGTAIGGGGAALELYAENPSSATDPSAVGNNSVAIGSGSVSGSAASDDNAVAISTSATVSGSDGIAIGRLTSAAQYGTAIGRLSVASAYGSTALGANTDATANEAVAIGWTAQSTGVAAVALGNSYASGTDSFAAAIANNSSSYGATGYGSFAIGNQAKASGTLSFALDYQAQATGVASRAIGYQAISSGTNSFAIGRDAVATGVYSYAIGASKSEINGKLTYGSSRFSSVGDAQSGQFILRSDTTDATAEALTTDNASPIAVNQIVLPNNSAYFFSGTCVARESAASGTDMGAWEFKGCIRREANAGTTALVSSTIDEFSAPTGWSIALSADTTNGGLAVTVTGAASTNIRWVATVHTSEVTYA